MSDIVGESSEFEFRVREENFQIYSRRKLYLLLYIYIYYQYSSIYMVCLMSINSYPQQEEKTYSVALL